MNAENSTGNSARLPLHERARQRLLLQEPLLSLDDVAALEHPADDAARQALRGAIQAAIDYGDLPAVYEQFENQIGDTVIFLNAGGWWIAGESYRAWRLTCPASLLSPLSQISKWLGDGLPAVESVTHGGAAKKTAALLALLAEIDKRAAEQGAGFNRHSLPGTKAEFHELLKAYCLAFRYIGLSATADYLKGECKFQHGVKPEHGKGAAIWALFPEYPDLKLG
jgi:hypothetical protein